MATELEIATKAVSDLTAAIEQETIRGDGLRAVIWVGAVNNARMLRDQLIFSDQTKASLVTALKIAQQAVIDNTPAPPAGP